MMLTQTQFSQVGRQLLQWSRPLILTHERPDGDALGAVLAMRRMLTALGLEPLACIHEAVPPRYAFLAGADSLPDWKAVQPQQCDGIVIVDTGSWNQLGPSADWVRSSALPRIVVDHHATFDDLGGVGSEAMLLHDATASSACGLLWEWGQAMNWPVDAATAEALLTGIMTDTGWLRFSNTDPRTLRQAADLLTLWGSRPDVLYVRLYEAGTPARLRLKALMLETLRLHMDQRVAIMHLEPAMFQQAQAVPADADELVNEAMQAAPVVVTALLTQTTDGVIRVNLRSKSPEVAGMDIDVAAIARGMGGGGHCRAAGARINGPLEAAKQIVHDAIADALAKS